MQEPAAGKIVCERLQQPEHCLRSVAIVMGTNRRDTGDPVLPLASAEHVSQWELVK